MPGREAWGGRASLGAVDSQHKRSSSGEPGHESAPEARGPLWRVWGDVRRGVEHLPRVGAALPSSRVGRLAHGASLPWHVLRALMADPRTRRRYWTVSLAQAGTILALALLVTWWSDPLVEEGSRQGWGRWLVYGAAFLSTLHVAQWAVIALTRDFHTELSREASLLMGVPVEDEPLVPRVRLNVGWMRNKLMRRWRALMVFAIGAPLLWLCKWVVPGGRVIAPALVALWGVWWFVVFTAGKSALAWREREPREPGFLRAWKALTSRVPFLRGYGSMWARITRPVFSPIVQVERGPWGFTGLALVRALSALPLVKCFLRPLIPVAAAHLLMARTAPAVELAVPADYLSNKRSPTEHAKPDVGSAVLTTSHIHITRDGIEAKLPLWAYVMLFVWSIWASKSRLNSGV